VVAGVEHRHQALFDATAVVQAGQWREGAHR
jgi:hypothetical protein